MNKTKESEAVADLEIAASKIDDTVGFLSKLAKQLRSLVEKQQSGHHITTTGAASALRHAADKMSERSSQFHEAARRLEPPLPHTVRVSRKTPRP